MEPFIQLSFINEQKRNNDEMMRLHSFDIIDAAAIRIPIRERRGVVCWNASCYLMLKFLAILARFFLLSIPLLWSNLFLSLGESSQERMGGPSMLGTPHWGGWGIIRLRHGDIVYLPENIACLSGKHGSCVDYLRRDYTVKQEIAASQKLEDPPYA
ncbi:hypothetical protein M432DRAFT_601066 [Thermoascus aurantiacus ATCC 26904]